jgi:hypothetical protein
MNAKVTILHDVAEEAAKTQAGAEPDAIATEPFDAGIVLLKQPIMQLVAAHLPDQATLPAGTAVRIDTDGAVWLGETEDCTASGAGFAIRVRLHHVLRDFETLARLAERFGNVAPKAALKTAPKGTPVEI